jgi:hypothetical protein
MPAVVSTTAAATEAGRLQTRPADAAGFTGPPPRSCYLMFTQVIAEQRYASELLRTATDMPVVDGLVPDKIG